MIKNITIEYLEELNACQEAIDVFVQYEVTDALEILEQCIDRKYYFWANWLVARLLSYEGRLNYAINAYNFMKSEMDDFFMPDAKTSDAIAETKKCVDKVKESSDRETSAVWSARAVTWSAKAIAWSKTNSPFVGKSSKNLVLDSLLNYGIKLLKKENI